MNARILHHPRKRFVGVQRTMTFQDNQTAQLWQSFFPQLSQIQNRVDDRRYSLQEYPAHPQQVGEQNLSFQKWALVEVSDVDTLPGPLTTYVLDGGDYAVFDYVGPARNAMQVFGMIFGQWLPASDYELDDRAHFEILPANYNPLADDAREEIWIPVKRKSANGS
jgi:AraC family transcriptional regulator